MKYIFRGVVVFDYNTQNKEMTVPDKEYGNNFNFCKFIPQDYLLMRDFFHHAYEHAVGQIKEEDLKDIEVN